MVLMIATSRLSSMARPSDATLCRRARRGDREAVQALVTRHCGLAGAVVNKTQIPPGVESDDLVQEGLIAIARCAKKWNPKRGIKFCTYAWWAARNAVNRYIENRQTRPLIDQPYGKRDFADQRQPAPDVAQYLDHLTPVARQIVALHLGLDGEPLNSDQIGERLGLTPHEVRTGLSRALAALRLVARPELPDEG